jgi:hypothetical protein
MGLIEKFKGSKINSTDLTLEEIEFLFILIKNSVFKGENLETLYNIVYKLQQQYIQQNK